MKDKKRTLKSSREKWLITYKAFLSRFISRNLASQKKVVWYSGIAHFIALHFIMLHRYCFFFFLLINWSLGQTYIKQVYCLHISNISFSLNIFVTYWQFSQYIQLSYYSYICWFMINAFWCHYYNCLGAPWTV